MTLSEYFDPHNINHLKAYKHLCHCGTLTPEFCDEIDDAGIVQEIGWQMGIAAKMADEWVKFKLSGEMSNE